ncbi:uncharacterized protein V6R79_016409, partial [Siganus canaliculatus]
TPECSDSRHQSHFRSFVLFLLPVESNVFVFSFQEVKETLSDANEPNSQR